MLLNIVITILFLIGAAAIIVKIARDKGWTLPAGLAAIVSAATLWFSEFADKIF